VKWVIIWSDFAEKELDLIFEYYKENASLSVAQRLLKGIISTPNRLLKNQLIGQTELQLIDLKNNYRYLVYKHYKIIYSLDNEKRLIKIADVFDTRQKPANIKRKK
jgi:plasmid stabilization system protein ParE